MSTYIWVGTSTLVGTGESQDNDWDYAGNWIDEIGDVHGTRPDNGDDIYFLDNDADVIYGLDQASRTFDSLTIKQSYTGKIGLFENGIGEYLECGVSGDVRIGDHDGSNTPIGSGRLLIDLGNTATTIMIRNSKTSATEINKMPIRFKMNNAATTLEIFKGLVAVADDHPDEESVLGTIDVHSSGQVITGAGVTLTNLNQVSGGSTKMKAGLVTAVIENGLFETQGAGTITTLDIHNKAVGNLKSTGTITTLNLSGTADFRGNEQDKTVTTFNIYKNASIYIDDWVTLTNNLDLQNGVGLGDITLDVGKGNLITIA